MPKGLLKKYFRVIVKPVALLLVFFVLVGVVSLTYWPDMRPSMDLTPQVRIMEEERLSNPLFLVNSLFTGNFGYSTRTLGPVSAELAWRWPTTLLLVGISIITTAAIGFGLSFLFKPRRQKPQVYAHSLRNFLFGSAFIAAILLLWIFVFQAYATFGSAWFPRGGLFTIGEPTGPGERTLDMLRHLVLPVSALTLMGTLRTLLTLWSSGTPFADKSRLKRSIYPITTIDFALFISAAVLVEFVFTLPGLGNMLFNGLVLADLNAVLAAFTVLLALGVGFGILSTLLDFIQIFFGFRQNLEKEASVESKPLEKIGRGGFTFVRALWRRKSLIVGGVILVCFALSAVLAPVIAPYDPSAEVADSFAPPSWMKAFAPYSNYPGTIEVLPYWDVTEGSEFVSGGSHVEGSVDTTIDAEPLTLGLSSSFDYPYDVAPRRFIASFDWSAQNLTNVMWTAELLLTRPNGTSYRVWFEPYTGLGQSLSVEADSMDLILLRRMGYEFSLGFNLASKVFASPSRGEYSLVFHVSFRSVSGLEPVKAKISIRNFKLLIPGRVHGVFGSDYLGRDVFSQAAYAAGVVLSAVLPISLLAAAVGLVIGFLAGYFQGWIDNLIMVFTDVIVAVPVLPFLITFSFAFGRNMIFVLVPSLWFLLAITVTASRNVYLRRSKGRKLQGGPRKWILISFVRQLGANLCLITASVILLSTAIDFFGFGGSGVSSWGRMLYYAFGYGAFENLAWWSFLAPMLSITLLVSGLFLVGYGLDED